MTSSSMRFHSK